MKIKTHRRGVFGAIVRSVDDKLHMKADEPVVVPGVTARPPETVAAVAAVATRCLYFVSQRRLIYEV